MISHLSSSIFQPYPKSTNQQSTDQHRYGAVKAFEKILRIQVRPEEVMLDGLNRSRYLQAHSALSIQEDGITDPLPLPAMSYPEYLHTLLWLKRLKEEDPDIVSPRQSARGTSTMSKGIALGGDGDTFGKGVGTEHHKAGYGDGSVEATGTYAFTLSHIIPSNII